MDFLASVLDPRVARSIELGNGGGAILVGLILVWEGRKQKVPKKILGIDYKLLAYLGGAIWVVWGVIDLLKAL